MTKHPTIQDALRFARKNDINVMPIRHKEKKATGKWEKYQKEKASKEDLEKWFGGDKESNIAYICGGISDNLIVLDFDSDEIYNAVFKTTKLEKSTTVVKTGKGYHVYFKTPEPVSTTRIKIFTDEKAREAKKPFTGVDIQGEGCYVLAPGSLHPSGRYYEFVSPVKIAEAIPEIKQEVIDRVREVCEKHGWLMQGGEDTLDIDNIIKKAPPIGGGSDNVAIIVVTWLRRSGYKEKECLKYMREWWRTSPSFTTDKSSEEWLKAKISSAYKRKEPYGYYYTKDPKKYKVGKGLKLVKRKKYRRAGFIDSKAFKPKPWADILMEHHHFACCDDGKELLVYEEGVYSPGEPFARQEAEKLLGDDTTSHTGNEIVYYIMVTNYVKREEFDKDPYTINLLNGLFDVKKMELREHSPDVLSIVKIQVKYDPNAKCPLILKFLSEVLDEDDIETIQELAGYCLMKDHRIQKAFMFHGNGSNGKSVLLNLLKEFLGENNTASVGLQELCENQFATAQLFGKLANVHADLPARKLLDSGKFKQITGGDLLFAEKKFQNPFQFVNFSKQIFSANSLPQVSDDTDAFFRRWIILNFPNQFEGKDADPDLIDKLTTPEELSGFLNWALEGLQRILKNGGFSNSLTTDQIREDYRRKSDPVAAFAMECLEEDSAGEVPKDELYALYVGYCRKNKLPVYSKVTWVRDHLSRMIPNISTAKRGPRGRQYAVWQGVSILSEVVEEIGIKDDQSKLGDEDQSSIQGIKDISGSEQEQGDNTPLVVEETVVDVKKKEKEKPKKEPKNIPATSDTDIMTADDLLIVLKIIADIGIDSHPAHEEDVIDRGSIKGLTQDKVERCIKQLHRDSHIYMPNNRKKQYLVVTQPSEFGGD